MLLSSISQWRHTVTWNCQEVLHICMKIWYILIWIFGIWSGYLTPSYKYHDLFISCIFSTSYWYCWGMTYLRIFKKVCRIYVCCRYSPSRCWWRYYGDVWYAGISGRDRISNCIAQYSAGRYNLSTSEISASGTKILIWYEPEMKFIHRESFDLCHVFQAGL